MSEHMDAEKSYKKQLEHVKNELNLMTKVKNTLELQLEQYNKYKV